MEQSMDSNNANEKAMAYVGFMNSMIRTSRMNILLCIVIMMIVKILNDFRNIGSWIIAAYIFAIFVHILALCILNLYRKDLKSVGSDIINNMTTTERASYRHNWRLLVKEYAIVCFSFLVCTGLLFIAMMFPFDF